MYIVYVYSICKKSNLCLRRPQLPLSSFASSETQESQNGPQFVALYSSRAQENEHSRALSSLAS